MSKILEVAKAFEQQSKNELKSTKETVNNAIAQHESDMLKRFQDASKNIQNCIQTEEKRLKKKLNRAVTITSGIVITLLLAVCVGLTYWSRVEYEKMIGWRRSAAAYKKESKSVSLHNCPIEDTKRLCVKIDPLHKGHYWGENSDIMLLPITEN